MNNKTDHKQASSLAAVPPQAPDDVREALAAYLAYPIELKGLSVSEKACYYAQVKDKVTDILAIIQINKAVGRAKQRFWADYNLSPYQGDSETIRMCLNTTLDRLKQEFKGELLNNGQKVNNGGE